jgi:hypothetical protein
MPEISINEIVGHLKEYLPDENSLDDCQLESLATEIVLNHIEENDEENYSEALCKSLNVAAQRNHMKHVVDSGSLKSEKFGDASYHYSDKTHRDVWKQFQRSLPELCPYLPKGGYSMKSPIGIFVKKADEIKITSCDDDDKLIL